MLAGALAGGILLVLSEFITLYSVRVANHAGVIQTVHGGSNNSYALVPVALLAGLLALAATAGAGRWALAALGLVGLVALLIGLLGDLPDAHHTGAVHLGGHYLSAVASPAAGMYLETLGAVILIATAGMGLLLVEPAAVEPATEGPGDQSDVVEAATGEPAARAPDA